MFNMIVITSIYLIYFFFIFLFNMESLNYYSSNYIFRINLILWHFVRFEKFIENNSYLKRNLKVVFVSVFFNLLLLFLTTIFIINNNIILFFFIILLFIIKIILVIYSWMVLKSIFISINNQLIRGNFMYELKNNNIIITQNEISDKLILQEDNTILTIADMKENITGLFSLMKEGFRLRHIYYVIDFCFFCLFLLIYLFYFL